MILGSNHVTPPGVLGDRTRTFQVKQQIASSGASNSTMVLLLLNEHGEKVTIYYHRICQIVRLLFNLENRHMSYNFF